MNKNVGNIIINNINKHTHIYTQNTTIKIKINTFLHITIEKIKAVKPSHYTLLTII